MEAVALDWEKIGIKVQARARRDVSSFGPKSRNRKTNKTHWVYGAPPFDEPVAGLGARASPPRAPSTCSSRGLRRGHRHGGEGDGRGKRAKLTRDIGQKLYDGYHGVMLGMRAITWAMTKKVGRWQTLAYTVAETNYEYITPAG